MIGNFNRIWHVIVGGQVSYLLKNISDFSAQVPIKPHKRYSRTSWCTNNDPLWVGGDSEVSLFIILLTTTPSSCECLNIRQNTLSMPRYFLWFQSLYPTPVSVLSIHYRQIHPCLGLCWIWRSTKIFKNTAFIKDMLSGALEVAKFEGAEVWPVSEIRGGIRKSYRNQMVHLVLRLKIKYSKAVSHFSLRPWKFFLFKNLKLNLLPLDIIGQYNSTNSMIHLPLSQILMEGNAINRSDLERRELSKPHSSLILRTEKRSTSTSFQPFNRP